MNTPHHPRGASVEQQQSLQFRSFIKYIQSRAEDETVNYWRRTLAHGEHILFPSPLSPGVVAMGVCSVGL